MHAQRLGKSPFDSSRWSWLAPDGFEQVPRRETRRVHTPGILEVPSVKDALASEKDQHSHPKDHVQNGVRLLLLGVEAGRSLTDQSLFHAVRNALFRSGDRVNLRRLR